MSGPTIRPADDPHPPPTPVAAPTAASTDPVQAGSVADAIRNAGRRARRRRWFDLPLILELDDTDINALALRLGLPTDTNLTYADDLAGGVDDNDNVRFLAHRILHVVQLTDDDKWVPIDGMTVRDIAALHAAGLDGSDDLPEFEDDAAALLQLFTVGDPAEVNVNAIASWSDSYRQWAFTGATTDGDTHSPGL